MIVVARFGLSPPPLDSGLSSKSEAWFGFFSEIRLHFHVAQSCKNRNCANWCKFTGFSAQTGGDEPGGGYHVVCLCEEAHVGSPPLASCVQK